MRVTISELSSCERLFGTPVLSAQKLAWAICAASDAFKKG
jgi:hypothetical protein